MPPPSPEKILLDVSNLQITLKRGSRLIRPVNTVDFMLPAGKTFALLGESGCGKSITALGLNRLLPDSGQINGGKVLLTGQDLFSLSEAQMRQVRGKRIGMIFQEPSSSLNPVLTVYQQINEVLSLHRNLSGKAARNEAERLLEAVGINNAQQRLDDYPFQFSGGMKQRVMIAIALAGQPELLIADEPTTALDVTIQAQVLTLLQTLQNKHKMGILLITHDLGVVARMAHHVGVMYAGHLVEQGPSHAFFRSPLHPYAHKLFAALPSKATRGHALETLVGNVPNLENTFHGCRLVERCPFAFSQCHTIPPEWHYIGEQAVRCHLYSSHSTISLDSSNKKNCISNTPESTTTPLLDIRNLKVYFSILKGLLKRPVDNIRAVDDVSFQLIPGRTLALVGESGCGKTTVGKAILQLFPPSSGQIFFRNQNMIGASKQALRTMRQAVQMVFQDPFSSLNPRMRIGEIIEEGMVCLGLETNAVQRHEQINTLLERIGLNPDMRMRYPHEFSGGQRQRIAIARALAVSPQAILFDEPTSALDVSVQAQLLNLIQDLQREHQLAYLFITHNLAVVDHIADDVAVMYFGRVVEQGPALQVLNFPAHPYTEILLNAILDPSATPQTTTSTHVQTQHNLQQGTSLQATSGNMQTGCQFFSRCIYSTEKCQKHPPVERIISPGHTVHCHWPLQTPQENHTIKH